MTDHRHYLDSKTMRCAECGKKAEECKWEQGRVAVAISQPLPPVRTAGAMLYGHEVRIPESTVGKRRSVEL